MSKSGLFAHFQSRDNLQIAVLEYAAEVFRLRVIQPVRQQEHQSQHDKLIALLRAWQAWNHCFAGRCMFLDAWTSVQDGHEQESPVQQAARQLVRFWLDYLARQVVQGQASHFQAALEQQRAEALMESYTAQRRLTHEFTNHIAALDALLRQGDLTGAQEYLSSVSKVVAAGTTILDTHNPLLDSLLSRKYEEAAQQGVELYFDLCDLKDLPFCGTDLVIVISNLLDNAIRAAAQAKPPEVYLRARRNEEEYLISVRNRVQKDLELVDGELPRSTKAEPGHGMGLVNVREVLDRCRCEYTLSCRDRWFRFTCAVPTRKL